MISASSRKETTNTGVYTIDPDGSGAFNLFFDQQQQPIRLGGRGGGLTVFQKRLDGLVEFHRSLTDSKNRFDNLNGELWLGLDRIYRLTKIKNKLREDPTAFTRNTAFVLSNVLSSERNKYKLSLRKYSGNYSGENRKKLIKSHSKI